MKTTTRIADWIARKLWRDKVDRAAVKAFAVWILALAIFAGAIEAGAS